jgi:hypothetical protein
MSDLVINNYLDQGVNVESEGANPGNMDLGNADLDETTEMQPVEDYPPEVVNAILRQYLGRDNKRPHVAKRAPPPRYNDSGTIQLETWLFRMKKFLGPDANGLDAIDTATTYMDGNAAIWWQSVCTASNDLGMEPFATWKEFADGLRSYLCPGFSASDDAMTKLLNLRQHQKSVTEYVAEFTNFQTRAGLNDPKTLQHLFINGLEPEPQLHVTTHEAANLAQAIHLALRHEISVSRNKQRARQRPHQAAVQPHRQPAPRPPTARPSFRPQQPAGRYNGATPMDLDVISMPAPLTHEERELLREQNGCFRCRGIGHSQYNCPWNTASGNANRQ